MSERADETAGRIRARFEELRASGVTLHSSYRTVDFADHGVTILYVTANKAADVTTTRGNDTTRTQALMPVYEFEPSVGDTLNDGKKAWAVESVAITNLGGDPILFKLGLVTS